MPRLKCVQCGQKKSDFVTCRSCAKRHCHDCIRKALDQWYKDVKELDEDINPALPQRLKLKVHPGHPWRGIGGCCMKAIEAYIVDSVPLEELPLLMGYPWRWGQSQEALMRRFERG